MSLSSSSHCHAREGWARGGWHGGKDEHSVGNFVGERRIEAVRHIVNGTVGMLEYAEGQLTVAEEPLTRSLFLARSIARAALSVPSSARL